MNEKREDQRDAPPEELTDERLVAIHNVQDEATATLLCDFLRSQGIEASAVPVQMPWFSTLQSHLHGYWGRVEVLEKDQDRARALVEEYLAAKPETTSGEET